MRVQPCPKTSSTYENTVSLFCQFFMAFSLRERLAPLAGHVNAVPAQGWPRMPQGDDNIIIGTRRVLKQLRNSLGGYTGYTREEFGISLEALLHSLHIIGHPGMGKSALIEHLLAQLIHADHGTTFLDFHGTSATRLLDHILTQRINDVVYFHPADTSRPIGLNVVEYVADPYIRNLIARQLVGSFRSFFAESWGQRLEYLLLNAIKAHLEVRNSTLLGVHRMFIDKTYRTWTLRQVKDPMVRQFWQDEFETQREQWQSEASSAVLNKLGQFIGDPIIRNIVGQVRSTISFQNIIQNQQICIVNLGKQGTKQIHQDTAALLASLIISKLWAATLASDVSESKRIPHILCIDEFQRCANRELATDILPEARKFKLGVIMAHQYLGQLHDPKTREAILGSIGNRIIFKVGPDDAEHFARQFDDPYTSTDFGKLTMCDVIANIMDVNYDEPFNGRTLLYDENPLTPYHAGRGGSIVKRSRKAYGGRREVIEGKIMGFMG